MPEGTGSVHRFPDYLPGSWVTAISTNKPVSVSITMWALNSLKSVKTVIKIRGARDWHNPCVQGSDSPAFKHILTSKSNFVDLKELCRYFFLHHWYWTAQQKTLQFHRRYLLCLQKDFRSVLSFLSKLCWVFKHRNKLFPQRHWCEWSFADKIPKTRPLPKMTAADDEGL